MKFSRELLSAALPEWRLFFIDYVRLKFMIKAIISGDGRAAAEDSDGAFWDKLEDELAKVQRFYLQKMSWAIAQMAILEEAVAVLEATSPSDQTRDDTSTVLTSPNRGRDDEGTEGLASLRLDNGPPIAAQRAMHRAVESSTSHFVLDSVTSSAVRSVETTPERPQNNTSGQRQRSGHAVVPAHPGAYAAHHRVHALQRASSVHSLPHRTPTPLHAMEEGEDGGAMSGRGSIDEGDGDGDVDSIFGAGSEAPSLMNSPSLGPSAPPRAPHRLSMSQGVGVRDRSISGTAHSPIPVDAYLDDDTDPGLFSLDGPRPVAARGRSIPPSGARRSVGQVLPPSLSPVTGHGVDDDSASVDSGTVLSLFDTPGRSSLGGRRGCGVSIAGVFRTAPRPAASRPALHSGQGPPMSLSDPGHTLEARGLVRSLSASVLLTSASGGRSSGEGEASLQAHDEPAPPPPSEAVVRHVRAFFTEGVDAVGVLDMPTGGGGGGVPSPRPMMSPRARRQAQLSLGSAREVQGREVDMGGAGGGGGDAPRRLFVEADADGPQAVEGGGPQAGHSSTPSILGMPGHIPRPLPNPQPSLLTFVDPTGGVDDYRLRFARVRKAADDVSREMELLAQYLTLNDTAVYKATKKRDKQLRVAGMFDPSSGKGWTGAGALMTTYLAELHADTSPYVFLRGQELRGMQGRGQGVTLRLAALKPGAVAWRRTKVYSIGCFDTFHHGHANLLRSLRSFGRTVVVGIHDDASYAELKGALPSDNLQSRMAAVRPLADQIFVIPATDPTPYLAGAVSAADLIQGRAVYVRGDDMPTFPARAWCESVGMPIYLLPRTQAVSSTYIKMVYGSDRGCTDGPGGGGADMALAAIAMAFSDTDYNGKPVTACR